MILITLLLALLFGAPQSTTSIRGVVMSDDSSPRPVRHALVTVVGTPATAFTDDAGAFAFPSLSPGLYTLRVERPGFSSAYYRANTSGGRRAATVIALASGQNMTLTMVLPRGGVIGGTIRSPAGAPLQKQSVQVIPVTSPFGDVRATRTAATTNDEGEYRAYGLTAGEYRVLVNGVFFPGSPSINDSAVITVASGEERLGIDIVATNTDDRAKASARTADQVTVSGRISFDRGGLVDLDAVDLALVSEDPAVENIRANIGSDGLVLFPGAVPGRYAVGYLTARTNSTRALWTITQARIGDADAAGRWFEVTSQPIRSLSITITDKVGAVGGRLTHKDATAAADFAVVVLPEDPALWSTAGGHPRLVWPDTNGDWEINGLMAGAWRVAAIGTPSPGILTDRATLTTLLAASASVTITPGGRARLDLALGR